jgi:hypothetical protein
VVGRVKRVKLDVRWDPEDVALAQGAAAALGIRPAVVMRAAVKIGLQSAELSRALRAGSTAGEGAGGRRVGGAWPNSHRGGSVLSDGEGTMPGAAAAPPGGAPSAPSSRPASAAQPQLKLAVVVARRMEAGRHSSGPIPPAVGARAVRAVMAGRVMVDGVVERDPNRLVDPLRVAPAPAAR